MTTVRSDWDAHVERYAPPIRRAAQERQVANEPPANAPEDKVREFPRRPGSEAEPANERGAQKSVNTVIQQIAGASIAEIDRVIVELQSVREMLLNEGDRVNREISSYASLSHASMNAMKVISDGLKQWRPG